MEDLRNAQPIIRLTDAELDRIARAVARRVIDILEDWGDEEVDDPSQLHLVDGS